MYYKGKNPTALKSQERCMDALLDLMKEQSFSKISIQELCKKANLSRQTFYLLFATKENVIDLKFNRVFDQYVNLIMNEQQISTQRIVEWFVHFLKNEYPFIKMLVDNQLTLIMIQHFRRYLGEIDKILHTKERPLQNYAAAFLAGALAETAAEYVRDKRKVSDEELSRMIYRILTDGYFCV